MADTGAPHSIPYPVAADAPAGHTQMQALATQVAARIGFTGKSIIATVEARTNTAYGKLTTARPGFQRRTAHRWAARDLVSGAVEAERRRCCPRRHLHRANQLKIGENDSAP
jgi:hypothetical protein